MNLTDKAEKEAPPPEGDDELEAWEVVEIEDEIELPEDYDPWSLYYD